MERQDDYDESKAQWVWAERAAKTRVAELEAALRRWLTECPRSDGCASIKVPAQEISTLLGASK